jgi:hypothetical protein
MDEAVGQMGDAANPLPATAAAVIADVRAVLESLAVLS